MTMSPNKGELLDSIRKGNFAEAKKIIDELKLFSFDENIDAGRAAWMLAVELKNIGMIKLLLDNGANPNIGMGHALRVAAVSDDLELAELLVNYGADVNMPNLEGESVLEAAALAGSENVFNLIHPLVSPSEYREWIKEVALPEGKTIKKDQHRRKIAVSLLKKGERVEEVAKETELSLEELELLKKIWT